MKSLSPELTATEPDIPWRQIARMRDQLAHRYFATQAEVVQETVDRDLAPLEAAVARMRAHVTADGEAADGRAGPRGRVDGR